MSWQKIETAPKDGRRIICYLPEEVRHDALGWPEGAHTAHVTVCAWRANTKDWVSIDSVSGFSYGDEASFEFIEPIVVKPTHWQPLPEPPAA